MGREAMSSRTATGTVRAALAEVAKALAHEHRVELIEQLAQGPRNVEALAERAGLSLANASQHLQQLRVAGLVTSRREGKRVVYRLADEVERDIVSLLGALRHVAEQAVASMERIVTAQRPILYYVISISYDIISKFWPIWSAGPRAAARHFALRRGGRLFLRVGCAARNLAMPITLSTSTMELAGPLSLLQLATTTTAVW